jgi:hypothetical protein
VHAIVKAIHVSLKSPANDMHVMFTFSFTKSSGALRFPKEMSNNLCVLM